MDDPYLLRLLWLLPLLVEVLRGTLCASLLRGMTDVVQLNQTLVGLTPQGPIPDEQMTHARQGIDLGDLHEVARAAA